MNNQILSYKGIVPQVADDVYQAALDKEEQTKIRIRYCDNTFQRRLVYETSIRITSMPLLTS
jgi:hypothetical protein